MVRPLGQCSLSSCPNSGTEDSDVEDGESRRSFSRLLCERMSSGGPLLARVQKHWTPAKVHSSEEADGRCTTRVEAQGTSFKQNIAMMRDMLREDMAHPSLDVTLRVELLLAVPKVELPHVKVSFLPYIAKRLTELSTNLREKVDSHDPGLPGDHGLQKGKFFAQAESQNGCLSGRS